MALGSVPVALADHAQPTPDITQMDYTPVGAFGPDGERTLAPGFAGTPEVPPTGRSSIPAPNPTPLAPVTGAYPTGLFNPSGKWVAYDSNVFTAMNFPDRHPDDPDENTEQDTGPYNPAGPDGGPGGTDIGPGGHATYGTCRSRVPPGGPDPANEAVFISGDCGNHQREYGLYYEAAMKSILGPYGVQFKRYRFDSPGGGVRGGGNRGGYLDASNGKAVNIAAVVPGADHPEETVLVSGHYDFTDSGPDAGWDSIEGHQEVLRMAFIMADYWRKTGTRPSATIKFIPWDSEESGTFGSLDYVQNNIPPGEEDEVRGYFNVDPCAGAYPAYNRGNPENRAPEILQLTNPANVANPTVRARIEGFNARAETVIDEVFTNLGVNKNATLGSPFTGSPGEEIFVGDQEAAADGPGGKQSQRDQIQTALGGLLLFSSDYRNFEAIGVPIFNLFPDYFGPKADESTRPGDSEGLAILHTPNDNLTTINKLTSLDQTGFSASEGWAEGMEMCAQINSWYMLQPQMAGAQRVAPDQNDVVAYFEALPNEAIRRQRVTFDAGGSYEYSQVLTRQVNADLTYTWDFGDGTTGSGAVVEHAYAQIGRYTATLTVRSKTDPAKSDTMQVPITVIGSNFRPPVLKAPPAEDEDGAFPLSWEFEADREGFERFSVEESRDFRTLFSDDAEGDINARWTVSDPSKPGVERWQASDSPTPKFRGNQRRSGQRSYWTGVKPENFNPGPASANSILTLKNSIEVPATGDPELSYWSLFQNESDDQGRVEVAVDDGNPATAESFEPIDVIFATSTAVGSPPDRALCSASEPGSTLGTGLENRRASLDAYQGKKVVVRFVYQLGPNNPVLSQPCGWYIDDIRVSVGTFAPIGTTTTKSFEVFGRPAGTYAYRIKGVYTDGVETRPSNTETVKVTRGAVPGGGGPGGGGPGGGGPGGGGPGGGGAPGAGGGPGGIGPIADECLPRFGFRSVSAVRGGRRGVRFRVARNVKHRFDVNVYQVSRGRRIMQRRVARFVRRRGSFTWNGRGRRVTDGYYAAVVSMRVGNKSDVRKLAMRRRGGRFSLIAPYARRGSCRQLRSFRLSSPVFGGTSARSLGIGFRLRRAAQVAIQVRRGGRVVRSFAPAPFLGQTGYAFGIPPTGLERGTYRVTITVTRGGKSTRATLFSRRL